MLNKQINNFLLAICVLSLISSIRLKKQGGNLISIISGKDSYNFSIKKGHNFSAKMSGNKTTGYSWYLDQLNPQGNVKIVTTVINPTNLDENNSSLDYISNPHPAHFVGFGGVFTFNFKAIDVGKAIPIVFVYKRFWETVAPARTVTIIVDITS